MRTLILNPAKAAVVIAVLFLSSSISKAQQNVIAEKDNTRPEITRNYSLPARITSLYAFRNNGYNDIQWSGRAQENTRKYIIEYTTDGINYQSAGEAIVNAEGNYELKHQTFEVAPMLYRVRSEDLSGKYIYTQNVLLNGIEILPVKIYPTIITGNIVNVNAEFPVERITVISESGQQVYIQDMNGKSDNMTITIPSLGKGMYWMNFSGHGWKATSKFIIP